jgi:hypothetical protein
MAYLLGIYWPFVLLALAVGVAVGWWNRDRRDVVDDVTAWLEDGASSGDLAFLEVWGLLLVAFALGGAIGTLLYMGSRSVRWATRRSPSPMRSPTAWTHSATFSDGAATPASIAITGRCRPT